MTYRLVVFGGGNMGAALVGGLLATGWGSADELAVVDPYEPTRQSLAGKYPNLHVLASSPPQFSAAILAVKPHDVVGLGPLLLAAGVSRVLSVAAGVSIATMEAAIGGEVAVVRSIPNTPALVGEGAAAYSPGRWASEADLAWAGSILDSVGSSVQLPEHLLDAATGLSGSGPAYIFLVAEALIEGGLLQGIPRPAARQLVSQLLVGSAKLLAESNDEPAVLRANVTSPGGTTAAGLRELERGSVRASFIDAVASATARSRELGAS